MRVFIFANAIGTSGGGANSILDVINAIYQAGNGMVIFTRNKRKAEYEIDKLNIKSVEIRKVPFSYIERKNYRNPLLFLIKYIFSYLSNIFWQKNINIDPKNDVAIINSFGSDILFQQFKGKKQIHSSFIIRGAAKENSFAAKSINLDLMVKNMSKYNTLIFLSELLKKDWFRFESLKNKENVIIPNCINESETFSLLSQNESEIKKRSSIPEDRYLICLLGSVIERKGQDILLHIMDELIKLKPNVLVIFVGSISEWGTALKKSFKERGFDNYIRFIGYTRKALEYLRISDVQILASDSEALPRVILESMALKVPIVASINGANEAIITHKKNGFLFDRSNPIEILTILKELDNDSFRKLIIGNSHNDYWTNFSRDKLNDRYKNYLSELQNHS